MFSRCGRAIAGALVRLALLALLAVQIAEPPLVAAAAFPTPVERQRTPAAARPLLLAPTPHPPIRLAQVSGYTGGSTTASGLLNQYQTPTNTQLQSIPNYSDSQRDALLNNSYYKQEAVTDSTTDALKTTAATSTDSTLSLVQSRALAATWDLDQTSTLMLSINNQLATNTTLSETGCSSFLSCAASGSVTTEETCTVHYAYEGATCHEYATPTLQCVASTETASATVCNDAELYVQLFSRADGGYTLGVLDVGMDGSAHWNCWDGPTFCTYEGSDLVCRENGDPSTFIGEYHILATYPYSPTPPAIQFSSAGSGCTAMTVTLSAADTPVLAGSCGEHGAQSNVLSWTTAYQNCGASNTSPSIVYVEDASACTAYTAAPWFTVSEACVTTAADDPDVCTDLLHTYGKYTEIADTCQPWRDLGCSQIGQTCTESSCLKATRIYSCQETGCTEYKQSIICSSCVADPPNTPVCTSTETTANTEFGLAAAIMTGQVTIENDQEQSDTIRVFPGIAQACKSNLLINCCNSVAAQEAAQQINTAITAVQMAMHAYRIGSAIYDFTTMTMTIMEIGNTLATSAQTAAQIMLSDYMAGMFSFSWTGVLIVAVVAMSMVVQMLLQCDQASIETATKKNLRLCVEVGTYCSTKVLGACLAKRTSYCCFSNKIARIIQEAGHSQLGLSWGSAQSPDCSGLTATQLQAMDWNAINFSEYIADLLASITESTASEVTSQGTALLSSTDFTGQAQNVLAQYGSGLTSRVTRDLTVPGDLPTVETAMVILALTLTGSGSVALNDGTTIATNGTTRMQLAANQTFTAAAIPSTGWTFTGWSGLCTGAGSCTFSLSAEGKLAATFVQTSGSLSVTVSGSGSVLSVPVGIACPADSTCSAAFAVGTSVTLTAAPSSTASFTGWAGSCVGAGTTPTCTVTVQRTPLATTAAFVIQSQITSFTPASPSTVPVGVPLTWTVTATGGIAPLEYQFTREDNGVATVVQAFSTARTYTWTPTTPGTSVLQVSVRSAGTTGDGEDFAVTEAFTVITP